MARTDEVIVAIVGATAYTVGAELRLAVRRRPREWSDLDADEFETFLGGDPFEPPFVRPHRRIRPGRELPPEILRFGVQFSDGRKATTVGGLFPWDDGLDEETEPPGPILMQGGGGGGNGNWEWEFWLWPMPPSGPLAFVVEWPAEKVEETRHEVDADLFRDAAAKSEVLWPETGASRAGGSHGISQITTAEPPRHSEEEESSSEPPAPASDR